MYSSTLDPVGGEPVYFLNGASVTKGVEAESTILVARGFSVYVNGTLGRATYPDTGLAAQNAPRDTETIGLNYSLGSWNAGFYLTWGNREPCRSRASRRPPARLRRRPTRAHSVVPSMRDIGRGEPRGL